MPVVKRRLTMVPVGWRRPAGVVDLVVRLAVGTSSFGVRTVNDGDVTGAVIALGSRSRHSIFCNVSSAKCSSVPCWRKGKDDDGVVIASCKSWRIKVRRSIGVTLGISQ
jgi:hypothetical protein